MKTDITPLSDRGNPVAISLAGYAGALLLVAIATVAGMLVASRWGNSPVVLLYLLPVLAAAIYAGLVPGLVAAVASALAYNYFFTAPVHTFVIHSAADIVTVVVLFLVAVVCSQLAASVHRQAQLASEHAARNAAIAGFARRLLSSRNAAEVAEVSVTQISELFGCHVAILDGQVEAQPIACSPQDATLSPTDLAAATFTLQSGERSGRGAKRTPQADWQFHPVTTANIVIATVGCARSDGAPPIAQDRMLLFESLLDQMALALERARLDGEARDTAALRVRDKLRSALLTSIGDEVKPRLKAIQAAVRALRRDGTSDRVLVAELDSEVTGIERHIDNLVDVSPGTQGEAISLGEIAIDLHLRTVTRNGEGVHLTPKEFAVLGELAKHAGRVLTHTQLLRAVWGPAQQDHVDYLRVAVRALRQKLERDPACPDLIINEPGVGYRLVV
jgi:two-component system, OmpR family, sensor histidine kinase KdpD